MMELQERLYSLLIVSAAEKFNTALTEMLPAARYDFVRKAGSINAARRMMAERSYDIIMINSPLPDDAGERFAIDTCGNDRTVTLLITHTDRYSEVYSRLSPYGIFVCAKPISRQTIETALSWLVSARERLRKLEKKTLSIEEKMEEIRIVNRAKWLLISELKMDEPGAHRYIEKQAMDRCVTRREIAEKIIKTYT